MFRGIKNLLIDFLIFDRGKTDAKNYSYTVATRYASMIPVRYLVLITTPLTNVAARVHTPTPP